MAGVRLSPDLFNIYSEMILRELAGMGGFIVAGYDFDNLRYADETVLIAQSRGKLQSVLDGVIEDSKNNGFTINCKNDRVYGKNKLHRQSCDL